MMIRKLWYDMAVNLFIFLCKYVQLLESLDPFWYDLFERKLIDVGLCVNFLYLIQF